MFKNLINFSYKRTGLQALGFYLAYLLLGILLGAIAGAIVGSLYGSGSSFQAGARGGLIVGILYCPVISFMILKQKKLTNNFGYILLALSSGVLGAIGGALLGLIPTSYLTTRGK